MEPTGDIQYFVNWDDHGRLHVPYRIWIQNGTHIAEFWRDGHWIREQDIYRRYVNGFDPTVQRVTAEKIEEVIEQREAFKAGD